MKIHWDDFLKQAIKEHPKEVCGFLFSKKPYSPEEEWFVFPVKNIAENPKNQWIPDKKEMEKIKKKALKLGLVKIGNIHTHPYIINKENYVEENLAELLEPSQMDLKFARKFNDIIRGIVVCDKKSIYEIRFHDKFGNKIDMMLE